MFTGIISDVGKVMSLDQQGDLRARILTAYDIGGIDIGASIACDGVCLTVIATGSAPANWFEVQVSGETLSKTTIGGWVEGRHVNLERALRVGDELGGHIVSGHVDGIAQVLRLRPEGDSLRLMLRAPIDLAGFIAPKGSVALNGTSLTVNEVEGADFGVNLIPHTRNVTTWSAIAEGQPVNIEVDTMARYVARLREWNA